MGKVVTPSYPLKLTGLSLLFTLNSRLDRYPTVRSEPVTWRSSLGLRSDHPSGGAHWDHWGLAPVCKTTDTSAGQS